jgi:hypothetical protein
LVMRRASYRGNITIKPMTALIAVSTCIRPVPYLPDTLHSMAWEGGLADLVSGIDKPFEAWFALNDGPMPDSPGIGDHAIRGDQIKLTSPDQKSNLFFPVVSYNDEPRLGNRGNLWRIFRHVLRFPKWTRLLFFEDDIRFLGKNSLQRMLTCPLLPDEAFVTFHDMKELNPHSPCGLHHMKVSGRDNVGLWGLQAVAFPRAVVEFLAPQTFEDIFIHDRRELKACADRAVEHFLLQSPWPYMSVHCPSLVKHTGAVSAANPGEALDNRSPCRQASADFDAGLLSLAPEVRF